MPTEPKLLPEVKNTTKFLIAQISTGLVLSQHKDLDAAENMLARNMDLYYKGYEVITVRRWRRHLQERRVLDNPVSAEESLLRFEMLIAELLELRKQRNEQV
jgi:hypothetical protein